MIVPARLSHLEEIVVIEKISFSNPWSKKQIKDDIKEYKNS